MAKTAYIETTIASAYVSQRKDAASVYRRETTHEWWMHQGGLYELRTSQAVLSELRAGGRDMKEKTPETPDALIEEVRETRRRLVAEHGGLHGWGKHLQNQQNQHPEKVISPARPAGKSSA